MRICAPREQDVRGRSQAHGRTGVAAVGLEDDIGREGADGVDGGDVLLGKLGHGEVMVGDGWMGEIGHKVEPG